MNAGLDHLDRAVVLYLALPLAIFLLGWLAPWAGIPLCLCLVYALKPLAAPTNVVARPIAGWQMAVAGIVGCAWTLAGGTLHQVFANADWHIRDAVLHDLVAGAWPVGYGRALGGPTLLRAPIGYYLPAALLGKGIGLAAAHAALAAWTALGVALFLLQVLTCVPTRAGAALASAAVMVGFSGLDAVGTVLRDPGSVAHWDVTRHLEWWAARYQYSSMTTQLFWVPNHALGGWLAIGTLGRRHAIEEMLPLIVVAVALWSPLTALGLVPFVFARTWQTSSAERSWRLLHPRVWAAPLAIGLLIAAYLTLDAGRIPTGWTFGRHGVGAAAIAADLGRQAEFFLLEAGLIGAAILAIQRSVAVMIALAVLALLPVMRFGAANDLVMRTSIPSLAVLAIGASVALCVRVSLPAGAAASRTLRLKKALLIALLLVGAVTPFQEFARAAVLRAWPANLDATLIEAACGLYPPHYVARWRGQPITHLLKEPHALPNPGFGRDACENPALAIEQRRAERSP